MITLPETTPIILTPLQIKALRVACQRPSTADTRRHSRDDVAILREYGLVKWLDACQFISTEEGTKFWQKLAGYEVEITEFWNWFIITAPDKERGMFEYTSIYAAWADICRKVQS